LERQQLRQCVDPAAGALLQWLAQPGQTQAVTLLTSRLFPQELAGRSGLGLAGVRRHDLTGLNNEAAYALFRGLGIETTRAEVQAACEPLGYHPLSLRLLARAVRYSPTAPNDLRAAANYDSSIDLLGKREHVLKRAYDNLPARAQHTLSRLAAFRSSVAWRVLADVFGGGGTIQADLRLLEERGLLQRTVRKWEDGQTDTTYDLHPIVRRYAYDRLADRGATHGQLVVYFEAVPAAQRIHSLEDLAPAIELYHHLTRAERYDEAYDLFYDRIDKPTYYQLGAYQTQIELLRTLFPDGDDKLPRLSKESDQASALNDLATVYSMAGRPSAAVPFFEQHNALREKRGNKKNLAIGLGNLAHQQHAIGALTAVAHNLRRSISLCREIEDRFREAIGHQEYGRLLATTSNWDEAEKEFEIALEQNKADDIIQGQGITWGYRAQAALLQGEAAAALNAAQEALRLADETARAQYPYERDYVRVHWLLGWARLGLGEVAAAQSHLDEALRRCRAINLVEFEPSILLAQARLAAVPSQLPLAGNLPQAHSLADEAQHIAARAGYVLDLADSHNFRAQLALDAGDRDVAQQLAQQAHDYAWCDGPPYAYQSALDEAQRLLALAKG
jgi:tetratricopeptide (TPR) repeat protein